MRLQPFARTILVAGLWAADSAAAQRDSSTSLRLARIFGDGMVVQLEARLPIWG